MNRDKCIPLMDNGHYHPTEVVSDKIPALLTFFPEIALHITRPVRWDSDHVVLFDDETKELCKEIVRCGGLDGRVHMALDYFDASINRISAWVTGFRNVQKALLMALLEPHATLTKLQNAGQFHRADGTSGGAEDHALRRGLGQNTAAAAALPSRASGSPKSKPTKRKYRASGGKGTSGERPLL